MIEMELNKVLIDEKRADQLIVLKEKGGQRFLPIVIGIAEASSIRLKLAGFSPPRPLTHDLLKAVIEGLGAKLEKVVIDRLENNTYHAKLHIRKDTGEVKIIDARPSDSIALAIRMGVPIFVEEQVLRDSQML